MFTLKELNSKLVNYKPVKKRPRTPLQFLIAAGLIFYELALMGILVFIAFGLTYGLVPLKDCSEDYYYNTCADWGAPVYKWFIYAITLVAATIAIFYLRAVITLLVARFDQRNKERVDQYWKNVHAEQDRKASKLAKIKASMTEAEWAAYEIQLENKKLLEEIKRNQGSSKGSTTSFMYGVIDQ